MAIVQVEVFDAPRRHTNQTLVEQITSSVIARIQSTPLCAGSRLPSIRSMAQHMAVSTYTVVEAYEWLSSQGWLQPRRGAGYFVALRPQPALPAGNRTQNGDYDSTPRVAESGRTHAANAAARPALPQALDVAWLLKSTMREMGGPFVPGTSATLPRHWLDEEMLAGAVRSVGRNSCAAMLGYGEPRGYLPLRISVAEHLQAVGIPADARQRLILTAGVTHAVDLVLRLFTQPGDTVLVEDPAWFLVFGRLAAAGVKVFGVPRNASGPDLAVLDALAKAHRPKLFFINSAVHNPTGYSLSPHSAHKLLSLAEQHQFHILEDDTYADLHPGGAIRLAALDGLSRVLHTGGFSKTVAAGARVAYLAAAPALISQLTDIKLLSGLTTSELPERVVQHIMASGQLPRHLQRVRSRVDAARAEALEFVRELGLGMEPPPTAGMFLWLDCGQDSEDLARRAAARGHLLAPGGLFSPARTPSTHIRLAISFVESPEAKRSLRELLAR